MGKAVETDNPSATKSSPGKPLSLNMDTRRPRIPAPPTSSDRGVLRGIPSLMPLAAPWVS